MRVCIVGAGAVGGLIGTRLAAAGRAEVSAIARGATLDALCNHGWRLQTARGDLHGAARASRSAGELGVHDLVVIAVKCTSLAEVAPTLAPLIGPETVVMPAMNGVPWWLCNGEPAVCATPLRSVDPDGRIAAAIPFDRVLGAVVHASAFVREPGLVEHRTGNLLIVGEPNGTESARVRAVASLLAEAGFDVQLTTNVRYEIWYKLWGNLVMNPVSAITGATGDRILVDPLVRAFCSAAMDEAAAIGARIGCRIAQAAEDRHAVTAELGAFRTSMLQDVTAGRQIELDAIVGAVHEIGRRVGVATPNVDALLGLTRLFARVRGLYPPA